jgi:sulfur-carrier protein adenylyltransferase/sulfurtransferase
MAILSDGRTVKVLFPDEAKAFAADSKAGTFTLLDVRQPFEYEEAHLPGAKLIPLPKLLDSVYELDRDQPILVYCATGGRSMMAAQLLSNQGFGEVYQVQGGINAWEATTASGPVAFHLRFVKGDEAPEEVIRIAFHMEEGLRRFHQEIQKQAVDADLRDLLSQLIKAEEGHKKNLLALLETVSTRDQGVGARIESLAVSEEGLMEGGINLAEFMSQNERYLETVSGYLEIAMMVETQALDLYLRMAGESTNPITKEVLLRIGDEEKAHLAMLGRYLERQAQRPSE